MKRRMLVLGDVLDTQDNVRVRISLMVLRTQKGWSQRFCKFEDGTETNEHAISYLNVDYINREKFHQLERWWKCDFIDGDFRVYDSE